MNTPDTGERARERLIVDYSTKGGLGFQMKRIATMLAFGGTQYPFPALRPVHRGSPATCGGWRGTPLFRPLFTRHHGPNR